MAKSRKWAFSKWVSARSPENKLIPLSEIWEGLQNLGYRFFQFGHRYHIETSGPGERLLLPSNRDNLPNDLKRDEIPWSLERHLRGMDLDTFFLFIVDPTGKNWLGFDLTNGTGAYGCINYRSVAGARGKRVTLVPVLWTSNGKAALLSEPHFEGDVEAGMARSLGYEPIRLIAPHPLVHLPDTIVFEHEVIAKIEYYVRALPEGNLRARLMDDLLLLP